MMLHTNKLAMYLRKYVGVQYFFSQKAARMINEAVDNPTDIFNVFKDKSTLYHIDIVEEDFAGLSHGMKGYRVNVIDKKTGEVVHTDIFCNEYGYNFYLFIARLKGVQINVRENVTL